MEGMAKKLLKSLGLKYDGVHRPSFCRRNSCGVKDVIKTSKRPDPLSTRSKPMKKTHKRPISMSNTKGRSTSFVGLLELEKGHPSRDVIEIIFDSTWGQPCGFPGCVEMVYKFQNPARFSDGFEDYRELVKLRAGSSTNGRCAADGNEMMRFHCTTAMMDESAAVLSTYSGSGVAHDRAFGHVANGRQVAMVVSRVIAGRVAEPENGFDLWEFDSLRAHNGELLVFDPRAVLPCFLVIYSL